MKTCKKLLAITIALVLLVSTLVSGLVVSAKEVGTLVLTSQPITESDADTKATVDLTFEYGEPGVVAPHKFITISTDPTFVLEDVVVASVNGKAASEYGTETDGDGENAIILNPCPVYIEKDGINTSKGLVLLESKLDENTLITDVVVTATYTIPANTVAGKYPVTATADYTDYYECDDTLGITNGEIVIKAAVVECQHSAKANRTVTFENGAINYNTVCSICEEIIDVETVATDDAATVADTVNGFKEYAAIELTEAGTVAIPFVTDSTNVKVAYVEGANVMASNLLNSKTTPYDKVALKYADGIASITSQVTGIIIVYTLTDSTALDAVLANTGMNYGFELLSSIDSKFKLNKNADNAKFDSYETVLYHEVPGETELRKTSVTEYETIGNYHCFSYPLRACELGDYVDGYFYGIKDGVHYPIRVLENANVVTYATSSACFKNTSTAQDVLNLKALIADMIIYGSVAQEYFNYGLDRLIAEDPAISSYVQQYATGKTFNAEELASMKIATPEYSDTAYYDKPNNKRYLGFIPSLDIQSKIELNLKVNFTNFYNYNFNNSAATEFDKISFQVQYVDYTDGQVKTKDIEKSELKADGNYLLYVSDYYPAAKMDQPLVLIVNYDGNFFAKVSYNIHAYLADKYNDTSKKGGTKTLGDFCKAAMAYGESAKTYFN